MPYSKEAKYRHIRYCDPDEIDDDTWATVPISHTESRKKWPQGTMAVVGKKIATDNWVIQSVLVPK